MAEIVNLPAKTLFKGTDHNFVLTVLNKPQTLAIDIAGWSLSYVLKKTKTGVAAITKTTPGISISGVYTSDPLVNAQVAIIPILDTDTDLLAAGVYYYEVKRTDPTLEAVIVQGTVPLEIALHTS